MLTSFFDNIEDPKRPLIGPNYWLLCKFGFILPKDRLGRVVCVTIPIIVGFFVFTQYMELYITRSDLDQVLTNLRVSMLSIVCVAKGFSMLIYQKEWLQIIDYVTKADKFERDTRDEVRGEIVDKYTKYCRRVTYIYWFLAFMTFIATITDPLIHYLSSATYREGLRIGTERFPHIFAAWVPFDKYSSPGCWIILVWHAGLSTWGGFVLSAYDSNIIVMLVFFGGKLDLMQERCRQMFGTDDSEISDNQAEKVIRELHLMHVTHLKVPYRYPRKSIDPPSPCFRSNLSSIKSLQINKEFRILLIKRPLDHKVRHSGRWEYNQRYMKLQNSVLSPVMFMYVVICSLMLCASTYQLTTTSNALQMLPLTEYLVFGIAQLFAFCWHCNDVTLKNQHLTQGLFESRWWATSLRQRKSFLLLMGQMNLSHNFTAGPFTNLTLATFITILKGAYSYYTLVRK